MKLYQPAVLLLSLAACDADPRRYMQEAEAIRGECTDDRLKAADEQCVQAMERGVTRVQEMMETYTGALHTLEKALDRNPPVMFDTTLARAVTIDTARLNRPGGWADDRWGGSGAHPATPPPYPAYPEAFGADSWPNAPDEPEHEERPGLPPGRRAAYPDLIEERNAGYQALRRRRYGDHLPQETESPRPRPEEWRAGAYGRSLEHDPELACEDAAAALDRLAYDEERLGLDGRREAARLRSEIATRCAPARESPRHPDYRRRPRPQRP